MARPLRIEFAGALYHITSRGNDRQPIYDNDADRTQFLEQLNGACVRYAWLCHAYCFMTNHYHLLIQTRAATLLFNVRPDPHYPSPTPLKTISEALLRQQIPRPG